MAERDVLNHLTLIQKTPTNGKEPPATVRRGTKYLIFCECEFKEQQQ